MLWKGEKWGGDGGVVITTVDAMREWARERQKGGLWVRQKVAAVVGNAARQRRSTRGGETGRASKCGAPL